MQSVPSNEQDRTEQSSLLLHTAPLTRHVPVSIGGAEGPMWSPDGSELFYRDDRRYTIATVDGFRVTNRESAFAANFFWFGNDRVHSDMHPDGTRVVSGSSDKTLKIWDTTSGDEVLTLRGHDSRVACVAFSPDGTRIVSGSYDNTLKVWDGGGQPTIE